jgi:ubiquinone/menaquinone biosynthesis C-methylase UbiE
MCSDTAELVVDAEKDQIGVVRGQREPVPAYLKDVYHWAYLSSLGRAIFDHPLMVHAILWGNMRRLTRAVLDELRPGDRVLQPACVYGNFSFHLSRYLGERGRLTVSDVAAVQVDNAARKLADRANVEFCTTDAVEPPSGPFDRVVCFFLLHEVPDDYKHRIAEALLGVLDQGGELVFVDYHRPGAWHPLRPVMSLVFDRLEPFAKTLWQREIESFLPELRRLNYRKETYFGGLYQKVVVSLRDPA